jgi:Pyruvate/2-oxoacid:ferredoxin oxidoreductase delta subunit
MTREEAIEELKELLRWYLEEEPMSETVYKREAVSMAISALSAEGDLISRRAALELIADYDLSMGQVVKGIHALPSVENKGEQRPKGHWITQRNIAHQKDYYYCSECREEFSYDGETGIKMSDYNFCPNCGADMRGEENDGKRI